MIVDEMGESTISHVILKYWAYLTSAHDAQKVTEGDKVGCCNVFLVYVECIDIDMYFITKVFEYIYIYVFVPYSW